MKTNLLADVELESTFSDRMFDIVGKEDAYYPDGVIDIFPYIESIPDIDLKSHRIYDEFIEHVWHGQEKRFDHVMVMTKTKNVYLVVVIDSKNDRIHGHKLLNLNEEYGNTE